MCYVQKPAINLCDEGTAHRQQMSGATRQLRTVARANRYEGFVGSALPDSISTGLTFHSLPYFYMDPKGIPQLVASCMS